MKIASGRSTTSYVSDARDKGYAEGDPEVESSWVLGQRAHAYYDLKGH